MTDAERLRVRAEALSGASAEAGEMRSADEARAKEIAKRRSEIQTASQLTTAAAREVIEAAPEESRKVVAQIATAIVGRLDAREQEISASLRVLAGRIDALREFEARLGSSAAMSQADAEETEELVSIGLETGEVPKTKPDGRPRRIGNVRRAEAQIKDGDEKA